MIEFVKEAGMVFVWLFLGYLLGERQSKNKPRNRLKSDLESTCRLTGRHVKNFSGRKPYSHNLKRARFCF